MPAPIPSLGSARRYTKVTTGARPNASTYSSTGRTPENIITVSAAGWVATNQPSRASQTNDAVCKISIRSGFTRWNARSNFGHGRRSERRIRPMNLVHWR